MAPDTEKMADIVEARVDMSVILACLVLVRVARIFDRRVQLLQVRYYESVQLVTTNMFSVSITHLMYPIQTGRMSANVRSCVDSPAVYPVDPLCSLLLGDL